MTTIRTNENAQDLIREIRARISRLERHNHPAPQIDIPDITGPDPEPPTNVAYDYVTTSDGRTSIHTTWDPPLEYVNGDPLPPEEIAGYEVESQLGGELVYDTPTELSPTRSASELDSLHDTRGISGVIRGEGGASTRTITGRDLWLWGNALVGESAPDGTILSSTRVHNALTITDGYNRSLTRHLHGRSNLLAGVALQASGATTATSGAFVVNGYSSTQVTATGPNPSVHHDVPIIAGRQYALTSHHETAQSVGSELMRWEFRQGSEILASGSRVLTAGLNQALTDPAPAQATTLRFYPYAGTGQTSGQVVARFVKTGVFESDHLMLSWRSTATEEQHTNVFTNPDGRGISAGSYSQLVATNLSVNPSFLVNTAGLSGVNGAVASRVATASAYVGLAVGRVRRNVAGNGEFFRLASSAAAAGPVSARLRVRRAARLNSDSSSLTLTLRAMNGTTVLASSTSQVVTPDDEWRTVQFEMTAPATTNALRVSGTATGSAWVASDQIDVDGIEFYQGSPPVTYFDGSTSPGDGFAYAWTGTAGASTSTMTATSVRRTNHFTNPRLASSSGVTAVAGASVSVTGGAVAVTTTAADQGARLSQATSHPIGSTVTASVLVSGYGRVRMVINGGAGAQSSLVSLSPGAPVRLTLNSLLTATAVVTVDVVSDGEASFSITEPIIERGLGGDFFHGSSTVPDRIVAWSGAVDASQSTASAPTPTGWAPVDTTRERLAFEAGMSTNSVGSVAISTLKTTTTLRARVSSTALTAGPGTITAAVIVPAGVTLQIEAAFSNATTSLSPTFLPGEPVRYTFTVPAGATSTRFDFIFTGAFAPMQRVNVGEVTLVASTYFGPSFTGAMSATPSAAASWNGTPNASTSTLTLQAADQFEDDRPASLVAASDVGLPVSHFFRTEDIFMVGGVAHAFMIGYVSSPSASGDLGAVRTGKTYLARFDTATDTHLGTEEWVAPSTGVWGTAVASDGTWLYVYGVEGGIIQVARTDLADPHDKTVWGGAAWVAVGSEPGVVAMGSTGFRGVRYRVDSLSYQSSDPYNDPTPYTYAIAGGGNGPVWTAIDIADSGQEVREWTASSPQGPFVDVGSILEWNGLPRTSARFHAQFDSNSQGMVLSTVDADAIRFHRGPPGVPQSSFQYEIWGDRQSVNGPPHVTPDVEPGTPFRVRVRAVTVGGAVSEWAMGDQVVYAPEDPAVPRPAPAMAQVIFRGARLSWLGTDEDGFPYEGLISYRMHMSKTRDFQPAPQNMIVRTDFIGGINYIAVSDYDTYYVVVVVETEAGVSQPSEPASFSGERLSDPDLAELLIDGAKIAKGTLNVESLTVGAFGNSLVVNPDFEVVRPNATDKPASWSPGHARQPGGGTLAPEETGDHFIDSTSPLQGARSLRIDTYATSSRQVISEPFPITPGDIYYAAARFRSSTLSGDIRLTLKMGKTVEDVNAEPAGPNSQTATVFTSVGTFTPIHAEGQVEVPDGDGGSEPMNWGAFSIEALSTGVAYSTWLDSVEVRQIVGTAAIANAAINNAKIANLAVDDAKISDLHGGKIKAETIDVDQIKLGVLRTNMIADPSFEEDYDFTTWDPFGAGQGNVYQWRRRQPSTVGAITERTARSESVGRSGARSLRLQVMNGTSEAGVISNAIPVKGGTTYRLTFNACSVGSVAKLVANLQYRTDNWNFTGFNAGPFTPDTTLWSNWTTPPLVPDPNRIAPDDYQTYSFTTTPPDDGWMAVQLINLQPPAASTALVDDVSFIEVGVGGASELTAAGLRLFDDAGYEVGAFVSNRPNYFSVSEEGKTVMSVSEKGKVSAASLSVADPALVELGGFPLLGHLNEYTPPVTYGARMGGHLDKLPRGLVAVGYITTNQTFTDSGIIYRLSFVAEPGRSYEIKLASMMGRISATNTGRGFGLALKTPVTPGSSTLTNLGALGWNYMQVGNASTWVTWPAIERTLRCNQDGTGSGGEINAGVNVVEIEVNAAAAATVFINENLETGIPVTVKDVGLDFPNTGIWVSQAQPNNQAKQVFTTVWKANGWRVYNGDGSAVSPQPTYLEHGPVPGDTANNRFSILTFGGNSVSSTSGGEVGKTVATALSGGVLESAELYLYADDWYDNNGGTASIRSFNSTSLPTPGVISGAARVVPDWPKPGGRHVDLSDFSTAAIRGALVGGTSTTDLETYGRFRAPGQDLEPELRLRYSR